MLGLGDALLLAPSSSFHQQTQPNSSDHYPLHSSAALGLGVFPFLAAAPRTGALLEESSNPNFWSSIEKGQQHQQTSGKSTSVCEDCGNRAKKGCDYRRCRTCCRSREYPCPAHVKSTWVPAAVRRERQGGFSGDGSSDSSSCGAKRLNIGSSSQTTARSFETSSCQQDARFRESLPRQVHAPAVFRCIRVTTINNGEAKFAYQVTVKICGHVFKGFLYDHGVDEKNAFPPVSQLFVQTSAV